MVKQIMLVGAFALLSGCASQSFHIQGDTQSQPSYEDTQHFFLSGLGQEESVDASEVCDGAENIIKVEARLSFFNGVLGAITRGLYTPREVRIYCKQEQGVELIEQPVSLAK